MGTYRGISVSNIDAPKRPQMDSYSHPSIKPSPSFFTTTTTIIIITHSCTHTCMHAHVCINAYIFMYIHISDISKTILNPQPSPMAFSLTRTGCRGLASALPSGQLFEPAWALSLRHDVKNHFLIPNTAVQEPEYKSKASQPSSSGVIASAS